jgi:pyruvate-formate lyase
MMNSYWDMTSEQQAEWLIEFTKIHMSFAPNEIELREAAILEHQLPAIFLAPEENDLIVGRFHYPPLVFTPQPAGDRGGFAYVADPNKFDALAQLLSSETAINQLNEAKIYWESHDTGQQTRLAYPADIADLLPSDNWTGEPGIGFPLLRMSGSHLDYGKLIELGIPGLEGEIQAQLEILPDSKPLFMAMLNALEALKKVILFYERRIRDMLGRVKSHEQSLNLGKLADALSNITRSAPSSLLEGIQLFYLYCLASGSNNFGRMDDYLGVLYKHDINSGKISREQAVSYFVHLWKLVNYREIIYDGRVIVGGKGRKNPSAADELALVIIDSVGISSDVLPQLTLRMFEGMDSRLKERSFDIIAEGNPYPMLYNDDVNIPSAIKAFEVDENTAADCIPFGCGEYVLYRQSFGTPSGVINLLKALEAALHKGEDPIGPRKLGIPEASKIEIKSFDDLWKAYTLNLEAYIHALAVQEKIEYEIAGEHAPFLFFSMLFDHCIDRGKALFKGGIKHLGGTLETYGNTNTADALLAIKNLVFEEKSISLEKLIAALDANFEGYMHIRKILLDQPKYGNDIEEADEMLKKVHDHVCLATKAEAKKVGLDSYLVVNINNSANTIFGKFTAASADGRLAYTTMANGNTPQMGMDKEGATALLNSIAKPATSIHAGASQNFKLSREMLTKFRTQTIALIDTYFENGGAQLMITAVNNGDLEQAMLHPEEYPNLLVRVGGFSARFVELDKNIQLEILNRTLY